MASRRGSGQREHFSLPVDDSDEDDVSDQYPSHEQFSRECEKLQREYSYAPSPRAKLKVKKQLDWLMSAWAKITPHDDVTILLQALAIRGAGS